LRREALFALGAVSVIAAPATTSANTHVVLVVPEGAPRALVDALRVEIQLSGHAPLVSTALPEVRGVVADLFSHSDAERAVLVEADGRVVVVDREGPIAETRLGARLDASHPRLVAMIAADLAARRRPPPDPRPVTAPIVDPPDLPRVRLVDSTDALTPPTATALAGGLAPPPEPRVPVDTTEPPDTPRTPWPVWLRVLTEIAFGFAGSAVLGVPAALITDDAHNGWLYGYAGLGPVGFALGTWLGGLLAGGEGSVWWTLLGGIVGGLVAGGLLLAGAAVDRDPADGVDPAFSLLGAIALITLPTTLSVLGFELTSGAEP
jgi:hypothetical protein